MGLAAPFAMATAQVPAADAVVVPGGLDTLVDDAGDPIVEWVPGAGTGALGDGDDALVKLLNGAAGALVIVTPGTDDTGLHPRVDRLIGHRDAAYVAYPESFAPVITGKADAALGLPFLAPSYVESRAVAEKNNRAVMNALKDFSDTVVYTGYSQGAEALGNAAEQQVRADAGKDDADKVLKPNTVILLTSDPRSPWGLKGFGGDLPLSGLWVTPLLDVFGIDNDGARNPADTDDLQVISVIVQGDPVADWQWNWTRPASSLLVNAAGFLAIHSPGDGPYGHLDGSENGAGVTLIVADPTLLKSTAGGTTYAVYDTYHPLALLNAVIYDALGLKYTDDDLRRWDARAEFFYPTTDVADKATFGGVAVESADGEADGAPGGEDAAPAPATGPAASATGGAHRMTGPDGEWAEAPEPWSGTGPRHARDDEQNETPAFTPESGVVDQGPQVAEDPPAASEPADTGSAEGAADTPAEEASPVGDLEPVA